MGGLLGLSMIARDGADDLDEILRNTRHRFDEVVVAMDYRTKDNTPEVLKRHSAEILIHRWEGGGNSFVAARNHALQHATTQWVMVLDCDLRVRSSGVKEIRRILTKSSPNTALYVDWNDIDGGKYKKVMVFPVLPHVSWQGLLENGGGGVHEDVMRSLFAGQTSFRDSGVEIVHKERGSGSAKRDRFERNLHYLERDLAVEPFNALVLYHLCVCWMNLGSMLSACFVAKRILALDPRKLGPTILLAACKATRLAGDTAAFEESVKLLAKVAPNHPATRLIGAMVTGDKSLLDGVAFDADEVPYNPDAARELAAKMLEAP